MVNVNIIESLWIIVGRYSDFISIDGKTFCTGNIERMMKFAREHNLNTKINTFMMYSDFPNIYNQHLSEKIKEGIISEDDRKKELKNSLLKYVIEVGTKYSDRISSVDIFNELIYNPGTSEKKDLFTEYELDENGNKIQIGVDENNKPIFKEAGYIERKNTGWQKYLNLDDLCEMAVIARTVLPNATFTYNDMNWVIPEKRVAMIDMVKRIQAKQSEIQKNGGIYVNDEIRKVLAEKGIITDNNGKLSFYENQTIIDNVGFEAHLSTETTAEQFEDAVIDVTEQTGLPVEVTEEDVTYEQKVDGNEKLKTELKRKQMKLFEKIDKMAEKGKLIGTTIWSLGKHSFTDKKYKYVTNASKLDEKFNSKIETIENNKTKSTQSLGEESLAEQRDTTFLDKIEYEQAKQQREITNQKEEQENVHSGYRDNH